MVLVLEFVLTASSPDPRFNEYNGPQVVFNDDTVRIYEDIHFPKTTLFDSSKHDTIVHIPVLGFKKTGTICQRLVDTLLCCSQERSFRLLRRGEGNGLEITGSNRSYARDSLPRAIYFSGDSWLLVDEAPDDVLNFYGLVSSGDSVVVKYIIADVLFIERTSGDLKAYVNMTSEDSLDVEGPFIFSQNVFNPNYDFPAVRRIRRHFEWMLE